MPLMKSASKKAFKKNMDSEMDAGKPEKQSLAIAYDVARRNKRKMALGGPVEGAEEDMEPSVPMPKASAEADSDSKDMEEHYDSIADAILAKKRRAKMAEGGMVDLEANSEESENVLDDQNYDALMKEQYDDGQISEQPEDSNEHGDEIPSDAHDMVDRIRSKMKSKRKGM